MTKSLKELALPITEEEYRADSALSYSTLAKFDREGFNNIGKLFDRVETSSLTFGSAVDSIITGGEQEFNERFIVAEYMEEVPAAISNVVRYLYQQHPEVEKLSDIPDTTIIVATETLQYQLNWRPETRAKVIKEKGSELFQFLKMADGKQILTQSTYTQVIAAVNALRESEATKFYFAEDNPFENIERLYQLKFKGRDPKTNIPYRCMMDLCIVDHDNKVIIPCDLKTSHKPEWDFYKSFVEWRYHIQARLYSRLLQQAIEKDPYFKDFKIDNYRFIVVNKETLTPMVWVYENTHTEGTVKYGPNKEYEQHDPYAIGEELTYYLDSQPRTPVGIEPDDINSIDYWLNKK
jgi:hypothetical protein